ncbi:MAG: adenylate/guanylate cyclase domain-containing protein [Mesorhizobium sp.]|uniref:adenylate/guanylate cyclase domain-containing protein n=1 Tax=Mesorhizobium sp. TaxID=1871066 RepID=UPI000FE4E19A|nr:adenylate/guanylate cyclase domain-containing protein [Mesorhizobium sp.]RWP09744.1 MAG: adenylate/guanylate cyclase domain-containing protein [Mesorhizobium sp.]
MVDDNELTTIFARPERKLAAILAADVAGYSGLMERDEEGTHERLQLLLRDVVRPEVETHRGRIVKTTGDGLLAEFASAIEAVRCAVGLQQAMAERNVTLPEDRRLTFRIGVNLGDIMSENGDVFGDGVNIAARLEGLAEAGGILISHTVHEHVDRKLPVRFDDQGECALRNIARPIRVYRVGWEAALADPALLALKPRNTASAPPGLPDKASIAVLSFTSMSSEAEQEFFADGLAEDLITDLSKVPGLLVIARHSSFAYKGRSVDIRVIAKELGVRYLIEGSVRRASARLRINALLVDAANGAHLWADRFDRDLADIFTLQDEVVGKIVNALADVLPVVRSLPKRRATNLEAYDLFVRGRSLATQSLRETRAARPLLAKAIEIDPGFAEAHAWLAMSHHFGALYCGEPLEEHRMLARSAARKAVSIDPENADAHIVLGFLRAYEGELTEGVAEFEMGLRINPNHAEGWAMLADLRVFEGRAVEGIDCAQNSFRLNPYPPGDYYSFLGWAQYAAGRYQDAVETLRNPSAGGPGAKRNLAAALAQLGRMKDAREEARKFLLEFPHFSAQQWGSTQPFRDDEGRQHFIDGYIKAGLPM